MHNRFFLKDRGTKIVFSPVGMVLSVMSERFFMPNYESCDIPSHSGGDEQCILNLIEKVLVIPSK